MNRKQFLTKLAAGGAGFSLLGSVVGCATGQAADGSEPVWSVATWDSIRELFPLTRDRIYLNTGGLGPPAQPVLDTMASQNLRQAVEGETYHDLFATVREAVASFINAKPVEVALTRNATESNSIVAAGLDLRPGDEVIFESEAHPGGSFPWVNRQIQDGIRVRLFTPDYERPEGNLERIAALVNERTRVIQVSHITAPTGLLFDVPALARFARERSIWLHIDGAQSAGMIPIDVRAMDCDSYATSGHKWLNGPQGTGFLYVREDRVDELRSWHVGAYSAIEISLPDDIRPIDGAPRFEYGTRNAANVVALGVAIDLQRAIGRRRIAEHGKSLCGMAREAIRGIPKVEVLTPEHPEMHASILTIRIAGIENGTLSGRFRQDFGARVRPVSEVGLNGVRFSWHVYHQEADVEHIAAATAALASGA